MSKPLRVQEAKIRMVRGEPEETHYRIEVYPHPTIEKRFCYTLSVGGKVFDDGLESDPFLHGEYVSADFAQNAAFERLFKMRKL